MMNGNLTSDLNGLIAKYGLQAVLTELAQLALDHGNYAIADTLLQVVSDCSQVA